MRSHVVLAFSLLMISTPAFCGHEFDDADVLPAPNKMAFDAQHVYFDSPGYGTYYGGVVPDEWYVFDRSTHIITQLAGPPNPETKGLVSLPEAVEYGAKGGDQTLGLLTGDADEYISKVPYCGEGDEGNSSLAHGNTVYTFFVRRCYGAGAVEKAGGKLLAALRYSGEDGSGPSEGVAVLDPAAHRFIRLIPFTATIIRADPFSQDIWMLGPTGVVLLDASLKPVQRWYFYRGFDGSKPALLVADAPQKSDPFAVVAWAMHVSDTAGWHQAVQSLPDDVRNKFTAYDFFMNVYDFTGRRPPDLRSLLPFFIDPMAANPDDAEYERVFLGLCLDPDPRVDALIKEMVHSKDDWDVNTAKRCADQRANKLGGASH